jgi:rhodanese-related sulfurtransferase
MFNKEDTIMVDVRTLDEYEENTLENAISIPLAGIHEELMSMTSGSIEERKEYVCQKDYIVFCDTGKRSQQAFIIFKKHGFKVFNGGSLI